MKPIFVSHSTSSTTKEHSIFKYPVPQELQDEITRMLKAYMDNCTISFEPIVIKLEKNDS